MTSVIIISLIALIASGALFISNKRRAKAEILRAIDTLNLITQLKTLLLHIQKHRGLSTGYLNGDYGLTPAIQNVQKIIDQQWNSISRNEPDIINDSRFEGVSTHWSRLKMKWKDLTIANNIEQHSRLILNLLYIIENRAENEPLLFRHGLDTGLDMIWKELLETIEAIGQARAIGTGVVAARQSSAVERIQLKFLTEKIEIKLNGLKEVLERQADSKNTTLPVYNRSWIESFISRSDNTVNQLMDMLQQNILHDGEINIKAEDFFDLATQSIEPLEALFDQATEELRKRCQEVPH